MSGILSLFSHFSFKTSLQYIAITISALIFHICFIIRRKQGRKLLENLPQATKKKRLRSKESSFTFQNEMPWKTARGRGSHTLSFVLFGLFFCIFSQYFCALFVIVPWMNWMCGRFNGKVTLSVSESKKKKKNNNFLFLILKIKNWQIVLESYSKRAQVIFRASRRIFEKWEGGANLSIGVIGVTSCCLLTSLEKLKRTHRTISSFQTHWRCRMRGFWLIFSPDRLTSRCTSVPQYYHPILSAPVVSHGTAVSNPAVAKSSSRPEEAACMRAYVWVGA